MNYQLYYRDNASGESWQQQMYAAKIVPIGDRSLPAAKASIPFIQLRQEQVPLQMHPLQEAYPQIEVIHYAMVIDMATMAEKIGNKEGIAFWLGNNASGFCASVTSEFGQSNVAPLNWEGEMTSAAPFWEWRTIDARYTWTNARQHGFPGFSGEHYGKDWIDGRPEDIATMYDPQKAMVRQTVVTPRKLGLGTAQQTLPEERLVDTYSIMLYFPKPEQRSVVEKLKNFSRLLTPEQARQQFQYSSQTRGSVMRGEAIGAPQTFGMEKEALEHLGYQPSIEIAHGNEIKQHVVCPINDPTLWQSQPSAVIVCWPVTPEQATVLNRPPGVSDSRKGFGW
jgi:hypothetical protein